MSKEGLTVQQEIEGIAEKLSPEDREKMITKIKQLAAERRKQEENMSNSGEAEQEVKAIAEKLTPAEREKMLAKFQQFEKEREQSNDQEKTDAPHYTSGTDRSKDFKLGKIKF